jgi:hypothetical protein
VVDKVSVEFDIFSDPNHWVAAGPVSGYRVTLEALDFPIERLELVPITDLKSYIQGTRRFKTGT